MTRVATPENQDYLLMIARHGTASHMERLVSGYRRAERSWERMASDDCYARRELQWYQAEDGMLVVKARRIFPRNYRWAYRPTPFKDETDNDHRLSSTSGH